MVRAMTTALRRYQFSERLADILGESRRDLRFRVTLLITGGLVAPGPRGPGSPPATPDYAADFLIGVMAAPQQVNTVDAVRCYRALVPSRVVGSSAPGIALAPPAGSIALEEPTVPLLLADRPSFGEALARLLDRARDPEGRAGIADAVVGLWVGRGFPAAGLQFALPTETGRLLATQRYDLAEGARPPAWLDPDAGGMADPGLFHSVFLPVRKLIEIGELTSPDERRPAVQGLGQTISDLAALARKAGHKRPWEKFLSKAALSETVAETIRDRSTALAEVKDFGSNPGNLRMMVHVPEDLPPSPALVVVLHGCTQTAASYDYGTGWSTLADRHGFVLLLPEQKRRNNPLRCFNWFRLEDTERGSGEAQSIRQMVEAMCRDHGVNRSRVYATGVSAGGAMTSVMLATYPDVFAGGAIIAGVPYRCAEGLQEGFEAIFQGRSQSPQAWGSLVRDASPHKGPWPKVSVWHGDADNTVTPLNAAEILKQWTDVHGLPAEPTIETDLDGHPRLIWQNADGEDLIVSQTIRGMGHGVPIDPLGPDGCGAAGPFILDVGVSSTQHIASAWGLTDVVRQASPRPARTNGDTVHDGVQREAEPEIRVDVGRPSNGARVDPRRVVTQSLEAAGLLKAATGRADEGGGSRRSARRPSVGGIDVSSIVSKSLEMAGLATGGRGGAGGVAGVDIPGIIGKSFEIAGLAMSPREAPVGEEDGDGRGGADADGGWQLLSGDLRAPTQGAVLFGYAASGIGNQVGDKARTVSCRLTLGTAPNLSYRRRLDLAASANAVTTAAFRVLVDGVAVDESTVTGMDYAEPDWTARSDINLGRFAGRTVTLTFEVAAHANILMEVSAKAWVSDITVGEAGENA